MWLQKTLSGMGRDGQNFFQKTGHVSWSWNTRQNLSGWSRGSQEVPADGVRRKPAWPVRNLWEQEFAPARAWGCGVSRCGRGWGSRAADTRCLGDLGWATSWPLRSQNCIQEPVKHFTHWSNHYDQPMERVLVGFQTASKFSLAEVTRAFLLEVSFILHSLSTFGLAGLICTSLIIHLC